MQQYVVCRISCDDDTKTKKREFCVCVCVMIRVQRVDKQYKKTQTELIVHKPKDKIVTDDDASPLPSLCQTGRRRP